jgi:hypothetical protein
MLGTCENKTARLLVFVDFGLYIADQLWDLLNFVKDGPLPVFGQKSPWVAAGKLTEIQRFELGVNGCSIGSC